MGRVKKDGFKFQSVISLRHVYFLFPGGMKTEISKTFLQKKFWEIFGPQTIRGEEDPPGQEVKLTEGHEREEQEINSNHDTRRI